MIGRGPGGAGDGSERSDWVTAAGVLAGAVVLRAVLVFCYPFDADEPQHMHVVWSWTQGLLQYRDVFDNHMPLFQVLCAPIVRVVGERPEALFVMRFAMFPLYLVSVWCVYRIGRALFAPRAARWGAVIAAMVPGFYLCSLEFRTDDLWGVLWFAALACLVGGPLTPARSFVVGLLLGGAVGVSLKTFLMLLSVTLAALGTALVVPGLARRQRWSDVARAAAAAGVGFVLLPTAITASFTAVGALGPFLYGTVYHNMLSNMGLVTRYPHRWVAFPPVLLLLAAVGRGVARATIDPVLAARRVFVLMSATVYIAALFTFWPLLTPEDYIPFYPLLMLLLTPLVLWVGDRVPSPPILAPALVVAVELALVLALSGVSPRATRPATALVADVLRLTERDQPVLDSRGESVFRQRPVYWVFEAVTRRRFGRGLLTDDLPERLVATRTCVVAGTDWQFPGRLRQFVETRFLQVRRYSPTSDLKVCGTLLRAKGSDEGVPFEIAIPSRYAVTTEWGQAAGLLDGTRYDGPRVLDVGRHSYAAAPSESRAAVVWAQAAERGFSPFEPAVTAR